ncbi:hypothetical protein GDO78_005224 [Eleutherodactylus coqui]|uniref:Uncharacterized protein n=1 Tax=Eleutherodactylus coqui TaxID=57060 RepID=A0A8J6FLJ0_ELECQ|nr:hypothetical protein GDO78_005224 [Eleutherodactylus coqui]
MNSLPLYFSSVGSTLAFGLILPKIQSCETGLKVTELCRILGASLAIICSGNCNHLWKYTLHTNRLPVNNLFVYVSSQYAEQCINTHRN